MSTSFSIRRTRHKQFRDGELPAGQNQLPTGEQCPICLQVYQYVEVLTEEEFLNKNFGAKHCARQVDDGGLVEIYFH